MTKNKDIEMADRLTSLRLPSQYKQIGLWLALATVLIMIGLRIWAPELEVVRQSVKYLLIICLFIASIASDEHEDERSQTLRMKSYQVAFLMAIIYALAMPFIEVIVDSVFFRDTAFKDIGVISVLGFMLMIQMGYYSLFKRLS